MVETIFKRDIINWDISQKLFKILQDLSQISKKVILNSSL